MQTLKVKPDGSITLRRTIFKPQDRLALISDGDTLILKKLTIPKISEFAKRAKGKPLSLKEIVKEIHLYRKTKKP